MHWVHRKCENIEFHIFYFITFDNSIYRQYWPQTLNIYVPCINCNPYMLEKNIWPYSWPFKLFRESVLRSENCLWNWLFCEKDLVGLFDNSELYCSLSWNNKGDRKGSLEITFSFLSIKDSVFVSLLFSCLSSLSFSFCDISLLLFCLLWFSFFKL